MKAPVALSGRYEEALKIEKEVEALFNKVLYAEVEAKGASLIESLKGIIAQTKEKARLAKEAFELASSNLSRAKEAQTELDNVSDLEDNEEVQEIYEKVRKN